MKSKLHIIVTSEEGQAKFFVVSRAKMKSAIITLVVLFIVSAVAGVKYSIESFGLKTQVCGLENNLSTTNEKRLGLQSKVTQLEEEKKAQLNGAYGALNQRSQLIDSILSILEIAPTPPKDGKNSGGAFTKLNDDSYDDLIFKVDRNLKTLKPLPLGYPVNARLSSTFGRRVDPINGKNAFHSGIDLVARAGTEAKATADGVVIERGYNNTYGWYVKIDHGKSFMSMYAHNQKILVKKGDKIKRGQSISLVGNTGRSTGTHLHYEIRYKNKPINPIKFMKIAKYLSLERG